MKNFCVQLFFIAEMIIYGCDVAIGQAGNFANACAVKAFLRKKLLGRVQKPLTCVICFYRHSYISPVKSNNTTLVLYVSMKHMFEFVKYFFKLFVIIELG